MYFRNALLAISLVFFQVGGVWGAPDVNDTQARIYFDTKQQLAELRLTGLDIVKTAPGYVEIITNPGELEDLSALGFRTEVLQTSLSEFYRTRLSRAATALDMGGYKTLAEVEASMTLISSNYPYIVTALQSIGTTHEGRDIWAVKISDNPYVDEEEAEVLFTGAIHAREVITPELLLAYMEWLAVNYGIDPEATELVDTREIWFVPIVNPDGYYRNEVIAPAGGGMWRKNRRDNGDGSYGVDLNRNYGYEWGYDNEGSSPNPSSDTYRGPYGFSEPETQAMRDFQLSHDFVVSCYYHSYSDIFLYPWGYDRFRTPDQDIFAALGDTIQNMNGYIPGAPWELLYPTNGGSFDWEYAEQTLKNKTFATTIEVGADYDGFWPSLSRKPVLIAENMEPIKFLTRIAGHIYRLRPPVSPTASVPAQVDGVAYTVSWTHSDPDNPAVAYELKELRYPYASTDPGETLDGWATNEWSVSGVRASDGPSSLYSGSHDSATSYIQSVYPYEVQNGDTLRFMTWYDLEFYYDFAYVEVSTDGQSFASIPGSITNNFNPNGGNQGNGITGSTGDWLEAYFDLSAFAGQQVWFRITCQTDFYTHGEGLYIDNLYPHLVFQTESVLATDLGELSYELSNRPIGVYYYQARARDAEDQWGPYSTLAKTDVLAEDKGDPDLDGIKQAITDLVLVELFFQSGLGVFDIYQMQQIGETDFDCDGLTLSENDLTALRQLVIGAIDPCYAEPTPSPASRPSSRETAALANPVPHYAVEVQSTSFESGDTAWVDIVVVEGDSSLLGYQFQLEYDPIGMTFLDARQGDDLSSWSLPQINLQTIGDLARLQLAGVAASGSSVPSPEDLDPTVGPMILARLVFVFDSEVALTRDLNFVWGNCGQNTIAVGGFSGDDIKLSRLAYNRNVFDADLTDITGTPVYGGVDYTCSQGLFGSSPVASIDFTSGRVYYDPSCCIGHTGDANNEGGDEPTIGDVSALIDFLFISNNPDFACITEADVNQSGGVSPTLDDLTIGDISLLIDFLFITQSELPLCL